MKARSRSKLLPSKKFFPIERCSEAALSIAERLARCRKCRLTAVGVRQQAVSDAPAECLLPTCRLPRRSAAAAGAAAGIALEASPIAHQGEVAALAARVALISLQARLADPFEFRFCAADDSRCRRHADRLAAQHLGGRRRPPVAGRPAGPRSTGRHTGP